MNAPLVIFVDVDDTLIRTVGNKIIPIAGTVEHITQLSREKAQLYCWSSGGADYARKIAGELGIEKLFLGFLPKPQILIDDQNTVDWRYLRQVTPSNLPSTGSVAYEKMLFP